jgi:hypothetical protein
VLENAEIKRKEIEDMLGLPGEDALLVSGKRGQVYRNCWKLWSLAFRHRKEIVLIPSAA